MANRVPRIGSDGTVPRKRAFTERLASIWHPLALGSHALLYVLAATGSAVGYRV